MLIDYLNYLKLKNKVIKLSKLSLHNQELYQITIKFKIDLFPGKYSLVYRNQFNDIVIKRFVLKDDGIYSLQKLFDLSNMS